MRVHSKFTRFKNFRFPILLSKSSPLTKLIIFDYHHKLAHAGCYALLSQLRKQFWIPHYFSMVKKTLNECILCKRFNSRTLKVNQNSYREARVSPPPIAFAYLYMDYLGPFYVKVDSIKRKVWLVCFTCMWSRAVNLKICSDQSVEEFLRSFQLHCFEYGLPQYCVSDLGTQLVAGGNVIVNYLTDPETSNYFQQNGVKQISFEQFPKGCNQLGSMVECCVKMTKRLIHGSIKTNILSYKDFEFLICQTVHIINRRPIAFKEALRDTLLEAPTPITPEKLLKGHDLVSSNVIPELQEVDSQRDPDFKPGIVKKLKAHHSKLPSIRTKLIELYHSEFLRTLVDQAIDKDDRYKPVLHKGVRRGDIVLLKEEFTKPLNYPMGVIKDVIINSNDEVTEVTVLKGKTKELVRRHATCIIPLLTFEAREEPRPAVLEQCGGYSRPPRQSAIASRFKTRLMLNDLC